MTTAPSREAAAPQDEGLVRAIGLGSAILFVVGGVIGSGIFLTTGGMAALIPSASLLLIAWTLGGVLAIAGGLTYAEMAAMFPRSGGVYVFLKHAYGPLPAFLYGWASLMVVIAGGIAAVAVGFAEYLSYFLPYVSSRNVLGTLPLPWGALTLSGAQVAAVGSITILAAVNYVGVRSGSTLTAVLTAAKVGALAALPLLALIATRVTPVMTPVVPPDVVRPLASFGIAMIAVMWTYESWYFVTLAAGEIKDARRNLPRALVGGILALTFIYLSVNIAYFFALTIDEMKGVTRIAERAATVLAGPGGATFIASTVVVPTFAATGGDPGLAAVVRDGARRYIPAVRQPRTRALPDAACRDRCAGRLGVGARAFRYLRAVVHVRDVRVHSFQRGRRHRAVSPAAADARSPTAVSDVGLPCRAAHLHHRIDSVRAEYARGAADTVARRPRPARARPAGVLVLESDTPHWRQRRRRTERRFGTRRNGGTEII
jgi:hypothetical protein